MGETMKEKWYQIAFWVSAMIFGSACGASLGTVVSDTVVALKDVICLLTTYSTNVQAGQTPAQATLNAAQSCGVSSDVANTILASHKAAEERETRKVDGGL